MIRLELDVPALERLIGSDTETEVHLRKQIVQEFAKRHLKEVAEQATYELAIETTKQLVNEAAKQAFDVENLAINHLWPKVGYRIKSMIESLVKESAQKIVDETLLNFIKYQKGYWANEVEKSVKQAINRQIGEEITKGINARLEAAKNLCST